MDIEPFYSRGPMYEIHTRGLAPAATAATSALAPATAAPCPPSGRLSGLISILCFVIVEVQVETKSCQSCDQFSDFRIWKYVLKYARIDKWHQTVSSLYRHSFYSLLVPSLTYMSGPFILYESVIVLYVSLREKNLRRPNLLIFPCPHFYFSWSVFYKWL